MSQTTVISEPVVLQPLVCCAVSLFFTFSSCPNEEAVNIGLKLLFSGDVPAAPPAERWAMEDRVLTIDIVSALTSIYFSLWFSLRVQPK